MKNIAAQTARWLLQINAIQLNPQNPFTWASGIQSPIYCDNRVTLSYPNVREGIADGFVKLTQTFDNIEAIAGVATAGIPHGMLLAHKLGLPFSYVRSKAKAHGKQNQIEGRIEKGQRILMVEDLISTGGSSLKAVDAMREAGAEVIGVLAIFTYSFDAAQQAFDEAGCTLRTLSNYEALLPEALAQHYISDMDLKHLQAWRKDPKGWKAA
ncbi:MAG: orotate phosphoribosyltransferase [Bacteroidota bacterium]